MEFFLNNLNMVVINLLNNIAHKVDHLTIFMWADGSYLLYNNKQDENPAPSLHSVMKDNHSSIGHYCILIKTQIWGLLQLQRENVLKRRCHMKCPWKSSNCNCLLILCKMRKSSSYIFMWKQYDLQDPVRICMIDV